MAELTDALRKRTNWKKYETKVPEWWPAAQIAAAAILGLVLVVGVIVGVGGSSDTASNTPTTLAPALNPDAPVATTTPSSATAPGSTSPSGSRPATTSSSAFAPTTLADGSVQLPRSSGGVVAVPSAAWTAAQNKVRSVLPSATITAGTVTYSVGGMIGIDVTVSSNGSSVVQPVDVKQTAGGQWTAS